MENSDLDAIRQILTKAMPDLDSFVIVASDKKYNLKDHYFGDRMKCYGMLDFMRRYWFVQMGNLMERREMAKEQAAKELAKPEKEYEWKARDAIHEEEDRQIGNAQDTTSGVGKED